MRPNNRKGRKKPSGNRHGKSAAASAITQSSTDQHHNFASPCCALAETIAQEILPLDDANSNASDDSNLLGRIMREYLMEQRQLQRQRQGLGSSSQAEAGASKRKRKRKRKKAKGVNVETGAEEGPSVDVEGQTCTTEQKAVQTTDHESLDSSQAEKSAANASVPLETNYTPDAVDLILDRLSAESQSKNKDDTQVTNRDLESFFRFLAKRFKEQQAEEPSRSKKKGKDTNIPISKILPTIQVKDVAAAAESIGCRVCRSSVNAYLGSTCIFGTRNQAASECIVISKSAVEVKSGGSALNLPVSGLYGMTDELDIDCAFDYMAMEEGCANEAGDEFSYHFEVHSTEKGNDSVLQLRPKTEDCVLDVGDGENLIRQLLLPCGLKDENQPVDEGYPLSAKQFDHVRQIVTSCEKAMHERMEQMGQDIRQAQEELDAIPQTPQEVDAKETTALLKCDADCKNLYETMTQWLVTIEELFRYIAHNCGPDKPIAKSSMDSLWRLYNTAMTAATREVEKHEGRVKQLASRPGSVPQMYVNKSHRSSHRSMLEEKLMALRNVHDNFCQILLFPERNGYKRRLGDPSLFTELFTHQAFYRTITKEDPVKDYIEKLDDSCEALLTAQRELTHTIGCASVRDLAEKQHSRYEKLRQQSLELCNEISSACGKLPSDTKQKAIKKEVGILKQELIDAEGELSTETEQAVSARHNLELLSNSCIAQWRLFRSIPTSTGTNESRRLPLKLKNWMATRKVEPSSGGNASTNSTSCKGGSGRRRAVCIIVGLMYRWLGDRCMEWHAELTKHELLNAMDDPSLVEDDADTAANGANKTSKAAKKAKKKREKKAADDSQKESPQKVESASVLVEMPNDEDVREGEDEKAVVVDQPRDSPKSSSSESEHTREEVSLDDEKEKEQVNGANKSSKASKKAKKKREKKAVGDFEKGNRRKVESAKVLAEMPNDEDVREGEDEKAVVVDQPRDSPKSSSSESKHAREAVSLDEKERGGENGSNRTSRAAKKAKKKREKKSVDGFDKENRKKVESASILVEMPNEDVREGEDEKAVVVDQPRDSPKSSSSESEHTREEVSLDDEKEKEEGEEVDKADGKSKKNASKRRKRNKNSAKRRAERSSSPREGKSEKREKRRVETEPIPLTDLPSKIGLVGRKGKGFESAESFLISRLARVLREANKQSDDEKEAIYVMQ